MRLRTVFKKLLCLQAACVRGVEFRSQDWAVVVSVVRRGWLHRCPHCSFRTGSRYDRHVREWRHIALGRWRVVLRGLSNRITCPRHGVVNEALPWSAPGSLFTLDFEALVAWSAREMSKTAVAALLKISWPTVGKIIERFVARTIDKRRLDNLFVIGVDEVSYRKGHKYITVVADHLRGAAVWMAEGRSQKSLAAFFDELGPERCKELDIVTLDMCAPYIAEVRARAPNARIAFDPFHVVKLASEAVHEVRRSEARTRKGTPEAAVLKGSRWALLKAPENHSDEDRLKLAAVAGLNRRVFTAYLLKEELRALYRCGTSAARRHLTAWLAWASRSRLAPFVKLARTLRKYSDGILAAIELGVSNGRLEGINNKIAVLKHRAYGFHSAEALIAMVFLCCSGMQVTLPL